MSDAGETSAPIASPCVDVCVIDEAAGLCEGCARTSEEIACWITYTPRQRREIMAELPARRPER